MRDAHRMKEKFDLSLDNRQLVSLLISGMVVLGTVFVLGVVVGKKLSTNERTALAPDLLTALDQKAAALEEVRQDNKLTFQDSLTQRHPPDASVSPVRVVELKAPEVPAEAPKVSELAVALPSSPTVTAATATKDGGLREAISRAEKRPAEASAGGEFTLQLSATQARAEADRFASRLRDRGYAPYVVSAEVPGRGTWYRVRMGSFPTKDAAARYLQDFRRETKLDAFVASTR